MLLFFGDGENGFLMLISVMQRRNFSSSVEWFDEIDVREDEKTVTNLAFIRLTPEF
jgi:hypothetical protein